MANSPALCHSQYLRARECEGRDRRRRQRSRGGWVFERMVLSSQSWRTGAAWLAQMRTLPPWLYIISPSLGMQTMHYGESLLALFLPSSVITHTYSHTAICRAAALSLMYMNRGGRGVRYPHMWRGTGHLGLEYMNNWDEFVLSG